MISAGGLTSSDLPSGHAAIRDPNVEITASSRLIVNRPPSGGTTLRLQLAYNAGDLPDPDSGPPLTIRVFGRTTDGGRWTALRNLNGDASVPIPISPNTDSQDSSASPTLALTVPDNNAHSWDCDGYDWFIVGVEKIHRSLSGYGAPSDAFLLGKMV
jgi:hypothetical protein